MKKLAGVVLVTILTLSCVAEIATSKPIDQPYDLCSFVLCDYTHERVKLFCVKITPSKIIENYVWNNSPTEFDYWCQ